MEWLGFLFLGSVAAAAVLAIYEKRRKRSLTLDDTGLAVPHDRARAAYTDAERIRAEGVALQHPGAGHF